MWGDLFNRPVCGFVQSGNKREANNSPHSPVNAFACRSKQKNGERGGNFSARLFRLYWLYCLSLLLFEWTRGSTAQRVRLNARLIPALRD